MKGAQHRPMLRADGPVGGEWIGAHFKDSSPEYGNLHALPRRTNASLGRCYAFAAAEIDLIRPGPTRLTVQFFDCDNEVGEGPIAPLLHLRGYRAKLAGRNRQDWNRRAPPSVMKCSPSLDARLTAGGSARPNNVMRQVLEQSSALFIIQRLIR